jgi:hypothetical protein
VSKKYSVSIPDEIEESSQVKWEGLRRNKEYQADYARYKELFNEEKEKVSSDIRRKYGVDSPCDPNSTKPMPSWKKIFPKPVVSMPHNDDNVLILAIDLLQDKKYLMYYVEQLIDNYKIRAGLVKHNRNRRRSFSLNPNDPRDIRLQNALFEQVNNDKFDFSTLIRGVKEVKKATKIHLEKTLRCFDVWDKRLLRKSFTEIAKELGISTSTATKRFYRAYEMIYKKPYNKANFKKPEIKKEYLEKECSTCEKKPNCRTLCPDVIGYVEQSEIYQREQLMTSETLDYINNEPKISGRRILPKTRYDEDE